MLTLEQYYIFTLNSTLNTLKVAGLGPQYIENKDRNAAISISRANSKRIYLYLDNVLVHEASSAVALSMITGISRSTISRGTSGENKLIYGLYKLSFTFTGPDSITSVNFLTLEALLVGINDA